MWLDVTGSYSVNTRSSGYISKHQKKQYKMFHIYHISSPRTPSIAYVSLQNDIRQLNLGGLQPVEQCNIQYVYCVHLCYIMESYVVCCCAMFYYVIIYILYFFVLYCSVLFHSSNTSEHVYQLSHSDETSCSYNFNLDLKSSTTLVCLFKTVHHWGCIPPTP